MSLLLTRLGAAGITANLAVTEANDTISATATSAIAATLAITEAGDTVSAAATMGIVAAAALTDAGDTVSSAAALAIAASSAITEQVQSIASTGSLLIAANAAIVGQPDTISATASSSSTSTTADLAIVEEDDTVLPELYSGRGDETLGPTVLSGGGYNRHEIDKAVKEYLNRKKRRALKFATTGPAYKQALAAEIAKAGNDDDEIILMLLAA
jgi:hypothetical protein